MSRFLLRRVTAAIPTLLLVSIGVFLLIELVPGDPAIRLAGGESATPERIAAVRDQLDLDDPAPVRFARWVGDAVTLDLGDSLFTEEPVMTEIRRRAPVTFGLTLSATIVAILIGVPMGLGAGIRPGGGLDRAARLASSLGIAVPNFILATFFVVVFAVRLDWLPSAGYEPFLPSPTEWLKHIAMPAIALGIALSAAVARQIRAALVDVMDTNYIRTAWAKGASGRLVLGKHALKNVAIPAVTTLGLQVGHLLGGAVIIEQIFSIPGLGSFMLRSIINNDFPVVQGVTLIFVVFQIGMSLIVDLIYGVLNPKVRVAT